MKSTPRTLFVSALFAVFSLSTAGVRAAVTNGLIAQYLFDGNALDSSGNGNNGNAFNVTYATNRFGVSSSSASFATADQNNRPYVDVPTFASLSNRPITLSVWFSLNAYPTAVAPLSGGSIMTLIGKESAGSVNEGALALYTEPGIENKIAYVAFSESGNFITPFTPSLNTWYNLAFTFDDANTATFYVNGSLLSQQLFTNAASTEMPFQIGSSSSQYFNLNHLRLSWDGLIDDIMVYDRALIDTEVASNYQAQSVPEPSTYALLAISGVGAFFWAKRRRS